MSHRRCGAIAGVAGRWLSALMMAVLLLDAPAGARQADESGGDAGLEPGPRPGSYLRVVEDDQRVALETAVREFERIDGPGPRVALVAVAHIGDRRFYRKLQSILSEYDVVLYESVLPPGARGPRGETPEVRIESTRSAMKFVAALVEAYRVRRKVYPPDLEALAKAVERADERLPEWVRKASVDAWGHAIGYRLGRAPEEPGAAFDEGAHFTLESLGADGRPGGAGENGDIVVSSREGIEALSLGGADNLQSELAKTLGLHFQLDEMNYQMPGWQVSDMAMDEVDRALRQRGIEIDLMGDTLVGTSMPGMLIRVLLKIMRLADMFFGGAIADTGKVMLIETLGEEAIIEMALEQVGQGFAEVIVEMRNQVAIDDLGRILEERPQPASVAIFYGAAHMGDLERRLVDQLGYRRLDPAAAGQSQGEERGVRWVRAIEVDLRKSAISEQELRQIRQMVRQMMRAQAQQRSADE